MPSDEATKLMTDHVPATLHFENLSYSINYTPIGLEAEKDQAFLSRLDMLKDPFTFTRDQAYAFMANLQEKMSSGEDTEE